MRRLPEVVIVPNDGSILHDVATVVERVSRRSEVEIATRDGFTFVGGERCCWGEEFVT